VELTRPLTKEDKASNVERFVTSLEIIHVHLSLFIFLATYYCTRVENSCQLNCALQVVQCDAILHVIGDAVCRVIGDAVCRLISILERYAV
jgi:hypothetical protein